MRADVARILEELRPSMVSLARSKKMTKDEAEDAASSATLKVLLNADGLGGHEFEIRAYAYKATLSVIADHFRSSRVRTTFGCAEIPDSFTEPVYRVPYPTTLGVISEMLAFDAVMKSSAPDPKYIEAVLFDAEGLSDKEAAYLMDTTVPAYKARLYRARKWFIKKLGASFLGP